MTVYLESTPKKLSRKQKLIIKISGRVFIEYKMHPHTHNQLPYYAAKCDLHGYYMDNPHGYFDRLDCPSCQKEQHKRMSKIWSH